MLRFEFGSSIHYTQIPVNLIDLVFIIVPLALFRIHIFWGWMVQNPNSDLLYTKCCMLHFI